MSESSYAHPPLDSQTPNSFIIVFFASCPALASAGILTVLLAEGRLEVLLRTAAAADLSPDCCCPVAVVVPAVVMLVVAVAWRGDGQGELGAEAGGTKGDSCGADALTLVNVEMLGCPAAA